MSQQIQITGGAKVRDLQDVIIGSSGVLSSLAFDVANGVPKLDSNGKILVSQLPNSVMEYKGTWNAATNTPTLADGTGNQGDVYLCNVAGTVDFGAGPIAFVVGDQVIYSGSIWQRASGATGTVTSVAITESGDSLNITGSPITTSGTINIGFNGTNLQYVNGAGNLTTFPDLTGFVPYTGATSNVNLGVYDLTSRLIKIDGSTNGGSLNIKQNATTIVSGIGYNSISAKSDTSLQLYYGNATTSTFKTVLLNVNNIIDGSTRAFEFPDANGTLALTSDIPILTGYVPYTGATANVDLGVYDLTADLITGARGSFASNGGSDTFAINHSSGGGIALNITKGGAGEGLYINKTSGSGNAATIVGGVTLLDELHLNTDLADAYIASAATWNAKQNAITLTTTGTSGAATLVGATLNIPQYQAAGTYVTSVTASAPLSSSGSTNPNITITQVSSTVDGYLSFSDYNVFSGKISGSGTAGYITRYTGSGSTIGNSGLYDDGTTVSLISRALSASSATFSGAATFNGTTRVNSGIITIYNASEARLNLNTDVDGEQTSGWLYANSNATLGSIGNVHIQALSTTVLSVLDYNVYGNNGSNGAVGNVYIGTSVAQGTDNGAVLSLGGWTTSTGSPSAFGRIAGRKENATSGNQAGYLSFETANALVSQSTEKMRITSTGGILMGTTTSTNHKLTVYSATEAAQVRVAGNAPSVVFTDTVTDPATYVAYFGMATATNNFISGSVAGDYIFHSYSGGNILFGISNSLKLKIASTGNVLIGTPTDSGYKLDVNGTGRFTGVLTTNSGTNSTNGIQIVSSLSSSLFTGGIEFLRTTVLAGAKVEPIRDASIGGVGLKFLTTINNAAEASGTYNTALTIASTGAATFSSSVNIGTRTASPNRNLNIYAATNDNAIIKLDGADGNGYGAQIDYKSKTTGGTSNTWTVGTGVTQGANSFEFFNGTSATMALTIGGNVLIGTTTDSGYKFQVDGQIYNQGNSITSFILARNYSSGAITLQQFVQNGVGTIGSITFNGTAVLYNATSDYRLKQDFKDYNALSIISSIKTYDFEWKSNKKRSYGVIAHELAEVIPYIVSGDKDALDEAGKVLPQSVDYSKLVPVLVKAIQELSQELSTLKQTVATINK